MTAHLLLTLVSAAAGHWEQMNSQTVLDTGIQWVTLGYNGIHWDTLGAAVKRCWMVHQFTSSPAHKWCWMVHQGSSNCSGRPTTEATRRFKTDQQL